ncbi:calcium-binding protein [Phaeobacter marinintestinus]|uniref:calcium-binding protein n=1 Tax=Falsiphaeobacter marinintestinus TaxID=1492905 RepID=UPI0011B6E992|nr:calcium-binding protein [Phaeobacter marinintestinus]
MESGLNLSTTTVTIYGDWFGPNFVNGLAAQTMTYEVLSEHHAKLVFVGGFNDNVTYVQHVSGYGFDYDPVTERYSGTVTSYYSYERGDQQNAWRFTNLDASLDVLNSNASDTAVTFGDLLVVPLQYDFVGAAGKDFYILGSFNDIAHGFNGDDTFIGLTGNDTIYGNTGDDKLVGSEGEDFISGGGGFDFIRGGEDNDELYGDAGDDTILGGRGSDEMHGGQGHDDMEGGAGNDMMMGDSGDDMMFGGTGSDLINGGDGRDTIHGGDDGDTLRGGSGNDMIYGNDGSDFIYGGGGNDMIIGGDGTNIMYGDNGNDTIQGGDASDELFGGRGNDVLSSGLGPDFLNGGLGDDILSANGGGDGDKTSDNFIFEGTFGNDTITDFEVGFDSIILAVAIDESDVTTQIIGDDVLIEVALGQGQSILVEGVASTFDASIDISFA